MKGSWARVPRPARGLLLLSLAGLWAQGEARGQSASIAVSADVSFASPSVTIVEERVAGRAGGVMLASALTIPVDEVGPSELALGGDPAPEVNLTFTLPARIVVGPYALLITPGPPSPGRGTRKRAEHPSSRGGLGEKDQTQERREACVQLARSIAAVVTQPAHTGSSNVTLTVSYTGI